MKKLKCFLGKRKEELFGCNITAGAGARGMRPGRSGAFFFCPTASKSFGRAARRVAPQAGRSMIEMLAILAIMGVLTVGGIAAYSFAVSKHRANQIYHQVDLRAVASFGNPLVRQTQIGQTYPLAGFDEIVENITYQHQKTSGNGYDIIASHVPERVCRRLQDMTFPVPRSVTLNEADLSSTCGADNTFVFHYDGLSVGKLSSGVTPIDCNCSGCQSCESGTCQDNDNLCGPKEVCVAGSCQCAPGYDECLMGCYTPCQEGQVRQNDTCDCVCTGFKEFDYRQNKCVCQNIPTGGNPETCECDEGYDLVNGVCVRECPDAVGMTGLRNNAGQCLCDTAAGYEEISVDDTWCNCDNSRYFWNKPDGSCMECEQTTKEWGRRWFNGDSSTINRTDPGKPGYMVPLVEVDSESVDEDGWYCGFHKVDELGHRFYYNPSTHEYCEAMEILKQDSSGNFYCSSDCGGHFSTRQEGDRGGTWGSCGCGQYLLWVNNKCTSLCEEGYTNYDGECLKCTIGQRSLDGQTCQTAKPLCANKWGVDQSEVAWLYNEWLLRTPSSCHASSGYSIQTEDGECAWYYGCYKMEGILPECNYDALITSECACSTGGDVGDYCCSSAQIKTKQGCQTCTGNMIPNAERTECVSCLEDEIPTYDRTACQHCPDGQIPNITKTKCYACPDGKTPDASGTACI